MLCLSHTEVEVLLYVSSKREKNECLWAHYYTPLYIFSNNFKRRFSNEKCQWYCAVCSKHFGTFYLTNSTMMLLLEHSVFVESWYFYVQKDLSWYNCTDVRCTLHTKLNWMTQISTERQPSACTNKLDWNTKT